jgi:hypothetical protein
MCFVIDSVTGSIDISLSGSLIPPSASAGGANGCFDYNPSNAALAPLDDTVEQNIKNQIANNKPQVCVSAEGAVGTSFALTTCSVQVKFGSTTVNCASCAPCGSANTGVLLDCSNVELTELILGTAASPTLNLPAFPCIGG